MTLPQKLTFKNKLKQQCHAVIEQRITAVKVAIEEAQQAANSEEKSSAGDKYETSRAMGHLEKDMHSRQLAAHLKELAELNSIISNNIYSTPSAGAYIQCTHVSFFIASGIGRQFFEGKAIVFLSPYAPLAKTLFSKNKGDRIIFDSAENIIMDVY